MMALVVLTTMLKAIAANDDNDFHHVADSGVNHSSTDNESGNNNIHQHSYDHRKPWQ